MSSNLSNLSKNESKKPPLNGTTPNQSKPPSSKPTEEIVPFPETPEPNSTDVSAVPSHTQLNKTVKINVPLYGSQSNKPSSAGLPLPGSTHISSLFPSRPITAGSAYPSSFFLKSTDLPASRDEEYEHDFHENDSFNDNLLEEVTDMLVQKRLVDPFRKASKSSTIGSTDAPRRSTPFPKASSLDREFSSNNQTSKPVTAPSERELMALMISRINQLEKTAQNQAADIKMKDRTIRLMTEKIDILQKSRQYTDSMGYLQDLETKFLQQQEQIADMEKFLDDYGLLWCGDTDPEDSDVYISNVPTGVWKPDSAVVKEVTINHDLIIKNVEQLNVVAGEGQSTIQRTKDGARLKSLECVQLILYANGIVLFDGPFRHIDEPTTQSFIRDLQDRYFPSELEERYPEGVPFKLVDKRNVVFNDKRKTVFTGPGNVLGSDIKKASLLHDSLTSLHNIQRGLKDDDDLVETTDETHDKQTRRDSSAQTSMANVYKTGENGTQRDSAAQTSLAAVEKAHGNGVDKKRGQRITKGQDVKRQSVGKKGTTHAPNGRITDKVGVMDSVHRDLKVKTSEQARRESSEMSHEYEEEKERERARLRAKDEHHVSLADDHIVINDVLKNRKINEVIDDTSKKREECVIDDDTDKKREYKNNTIVDTAKKREEQVIDDKTEKRDNKLNTAKKPEERIKDNENEKREYKNKDELLSTSKTEVNSITEDEIIAEAKKYLYTPSREKTVSRLDNKTETKIEDEKANTDKSNTRKKEEHGSILSSIKRKLSDTVSSLPSVHKPNWKSPSKSSDDHQGLVASLKNPSKQFECLSTIPSTTAAQIITETIIPGSKLSMDQFLNKIPMCVIMDGKVVPIREEVRQTLTSSVPTPKKVTLEQNLTNAERRSIDSVNADVTDSELADVLKWMCEVKHRDSTTCEKCLIPPIRKGKGKRVEKKRMSDIASASTSIYQRSSLNMPSADLSYATLRIRTPSGESSVKLKMHVESTIADVKRRLDTQRPPGSPAYNLVLPYPCRTLYDDNSTLEQYGITRNSLLYMSTKKKS